MIPLTGCIVSIITPFYHNRIDYDAFTRILELEIASKVSAVSVLDHIGEPFSLTEDERLSLIQFAVERIDGRVPVIACAYATDTSSVINFAKSAEAIGADFIMVTDPYPEKVGQEELFAHYETILDNIESPVLIKTGSRAPGKGAEPATMAALVRDHTIAGTVICSEDLSETIQLIETCPSVRLYAGSDLLAFPLYCLGAKGVFSAAANVFPDAVREMYEFSADEKYVQAREMLMKLAPAIRLISSGQPAVSVKYMMHAMRLCEDEVRLPLIPAGDNDRKRLTGILEDLQIL